MFHCRDNATFCFSIQKLRNFGSFPFSDYYEKCCSAESHCVDIFISFCIVAQGCHNEIPQTGRLKQHKFIFSQFWASRYQQCWCLLRATPLDCRWLSSHHVLTLLLLCVGWRQRTCSSPKALALLGHGSTFMAS